MRKKYQTPLMAAAMLALAAPAMTAAPGAEPSAISAPQPQAECTGTIVDNTGEPLIGATVKVVGNDKAVAVTNIDGKFSLRNVKPGSTIVVSYIGYDELKAVWNGQPLSLVMQPSASSLDEVVVLGYNVQTKESLTGALSVVKGDKLRDVTSPSLTNMLNGKVPACMWLPAAASPVPAAL